MDFESPDVEKDFPGLYASESSKKSHSNSDYSDDDKSGKKDILGKKKDKKESKKDKGYMAFEGESSDNEGSKPRSPSRGKKNKSAFKFPGKDKKEKPVKAKEKDTKEKKEDDDSRSSKKEVKESKKENKKSKHKTKEEKSKREIKLPRIRDKEKKKSVADQGLEEKQIFGIPLHEAVERNKGHDNISVPVIVRECIDYIEEHGITCEGIYRISGVKSKVQQLKMQYNKGEKIYFYEHEPHVIASLLKQFLRDLPEPLLTTDLMSKFEETATMKNEEKQISTLKNLFDCLPTCNYLLISWIVIHMVHVAKLESKNKMNIQNLSIVFGPPMKISHQLLHVLFTQSSILFKGIEIKKYVPSVCPDTDYLLLETGSPSAIEEELRQHENLLNVIHSELNAGLRDAEKEEQLWEIQRIVTQLKRKLRFLCQMQDASKSVNAVNSDESKQEEKTLPSSEDHSTATVPVNQNHDSCQANNNLCMETNTHEIDTLEKTDSEIYPEMNQTVVPAEESTSENIVCAVNLHDQIPVDVVNVISESSAFEVVTNDLADPVIQEIEINDPSPQHTETELDAALTDEMYVLNNQGLMLIIEEEELSFLADELKRKIVGERAEIKRLKANIAECVQLHKYHQLSPDSQENSTDSNDSSGSDENETDVLNDIIKKNKILKLKNIELSKDILHERETCIDLKVQIKIALKMRNI